MEDDPVSEEEELFNFDEDTAIGVDEEEPVPKRPLSEQNCVYGAVRFPQLRVSAPGPIQAFEMQVVDIECQQRPRRHQFDDRSVLDVFDSDSPIGEKRSRPSGRAPAFFVPCIRVYGKLREGASVCVNVYGVYPTVHLLLSPQPTPEALEKIAEYVEGILKRGDRGDRAEGYKRVLGARIVDGFPAFPYTEDPLLFVEFKLAAPSFARCFGEHFAAEDEFQIVDGPKYTASPYSCLNIVDQFQADTGIVGFGWLRVSASAVVEVGTKDRSMCALEVETNVRNITPFVDDYIVPLRVLAFDIECANTSQNGMPEARKDPIILVACIISDYKNGQCEKSRRIVLQLGTSLPLPQTQLNPENGDMHLQFSQANMLLAELDMLETFGALIRDADPDMLAGHNVIRFDMPYVMNRAHGLSQQFNRASDLLPESLGRRRADQWMAPRELTKGRKNGTKRTTITFETPGRIQLDTFTWIYGLEKLRSYRLGYLGLLYLGEGKAEVHHKMITPLWKTSDETRGRLASYCLQDTILTHGLINHAKFCMVLTTVEISRQARSCAGKLLRSGVQAKVFGIIYYKAKHPNFDSNNTPVLFPFETPKTRETDEKYAGAIVLEPTRGFYRNETTACADFRSLYPSIMILLNICWTMEILHPKYAHRVGRKSPNGVKFCDSKHRVGLIPTAQIELFRDRDSAKASMKSAKDAATRSLYDTRQNQIKILMNSMYGVLGASGGRLVREELALAVTSQGQDMILTTKRIAEAAPFNAKVTYG